MSEFCNRSSNNLSVDVLQRKSFRITVITLTIFVQINYTHYPDHYALII